MRSCVYPRQRRGQRHYQRLTTTKERRGIAKVTTSVDKIALTIIIIVILWVPKPAGSTEETALHVTLYGPVDI